MMKKLVTTLSIFLLISFSSICGAVSPGEGGGAGGTSLEKNRNILIYVNQPSIDLVGPLIFLDLSRFLLLSSEQLSKFDLIALPDGSLVESNVIRKLVDEKLTNNPNSVLIIIPVDRKLLK